MVIEVADYVPRSSVKVHNQSTRAACAAHARLTSARSATAAKKLQEKREEKTSGEAGGTDGRTHGRTELGSYRGPSSRLAQNSFRTTLVPSPPRGEPPSTQLPPMRKHIGGAINTCRHPPLLSGCHNTIPPVVTLIRPYGVSFSLWSFIQSYRGMWVRVVSSWQGRMVRGCCVHLIRPWTIIVPDVAQPWPVRGTGPCLFSLLIVYHVLDVASRDT